MKKSLSILAVLVTVSLSAQVGINTTTPTPGTALHIAPGPGGSLLKVEDTPLVTTAEYVVVTNADGIYRKVLLSSLTGGNSGQCPNFLKSISSGYAIHFSSPASVPNPNNPLTIQGKNFAPAAAWITGNTYYYSWSNTTGQPININNMTVNFSGLICNYQ